MNARTLTDWFTQTVHRPYTADTSYTSNNGSHDSDTEWHSITVTDRNSCPRAAGRSIRHRIADDTCDSHIYPAPSTQPPSVTPRNPSDIIITADADCTYIYPKSGKACVTDIAGMNKRNQARHWLTCHALHKVILIHGKKKKNLSQAIIINFAARKMVAERYLAICPLETCEGKPRLNSCATTAWFAT
jgi:hypothetical protein